MLIFGSNLHVINDVKSILCASFDMKDLGKSNIHIKENLFRSISLHREGSKEIQLF